MEKRINRQELAALLALATGRSLEICEKFLDSLTGIVEEELAKGESVRIKGFGTFKLNDIEARKSVNVATGEEYEIPAHKRIIFVAAKELAAMVNLPFEDFDAVEIEEGGVPEEDEVAESPEEEIAESMEEEVAAMASAPVPESQESEPEEASEELEYNVEEENPAPRFKFAKGFFAGFLAAVAVVSVLILIAYWSGWFHASDSVAISGKESLSQENVVSTPKIVQAATDTIQQAEVLTAADTIVPTLPSDQPVEKVTAEEGKPKVEPPVYDTVTTTRYLTTIAKEHYGNFNLWPIIYEENEKILGHPDRIKPGTKVVVPPLSKYGVDPKNEAQVKEIKRKGVAIYARFKR